MPAPAEFPREPHEPRRRLRRADPPWLPRFHWCQWGWTWAGRHLVTSPHLHRELLLEGECRTNTVLHFLGRLVTDHQAVLLPDMVGNHFIQIHAAEPDGLVSHDVVETDHGYLSGATADVDHKVALG